MKKNEIYEGTVETLKFPNKGYVKLEQEEAVVLVKNTLPGQEVRFQIKKAGKSNPQGNLIGVIKPSPMENQIPPCRHFDCCGGCSYQTMDYETQRKLKLEQVQALLKNVMPEFPLEECLASPMEWGYRNKMEFSFGDEYKDGPLALGLHKRGSFYDIVPVCGCQIVDGDVRAILKETLEKKQKKKMPFYHKMRHDGILRHLMIRKAHKTNEILVCLVTTSDWRGEDGSSSWPKESVLSEYRDRLLALPLTGSYAGILHMENDRLSDVVVSDHTSVLYGHDYFYEELLGLKFKISPFSFFQTNSSGAEVLYELVREYIGDIKGKVVFDLYSGTGTIAQVLAPVTKKVVGVEIVEEAVVAARENAKRNHLDQCFFHAGDVLKVIDELKEIPDAIVLDPPREGVHPKALKKILEFGVNTIVYISCKPTSLARDLETFLEYGYRPVRSQCVDMFPWTRGVETVIRLDRIKN